VAISALAVAAAMGPSLFTQAVAADPSSAQTSQHDALIQAAQACHQLTLFQISQKQTDAQTKEEAAESDCVSQSRQRESFSGYAPSCITKAKTAYDDTLTALTKQKFDADGLLKNETAAIGYAFTNINSCPQACTAGMRQVYTTPAAQLSCSQLASLLGVSTTPASQ
jgi:hypothetical protein